MGTWIDSIKELMSHQYNTRTKQIENTKPGTRSWYHEERHKWQDEHGVMDVASWLYFFCIPMTIIILLWYPWLSLFAVLPVGVHFALMTAIEVDAWIYALSKQESNYAG